MLHSGDTVALVCCSNGQSENCRKQNQQLCKVLESFGLVVWESPYLYAGETLFPADARTRAAILMDCYRNQTIRAIFDISGGDIANEILDFLDFSVIGSNPKPLFGYSDLTCLLHAVYTMTGQSSFLYQVKNLVKQDAQRQKERFYRTLFEGQRDLFEAHFHFFQGDHMSGTVVGGNARCLLKLSGTPFWPDFSGKLLFLEAFGGGAAQITDYFSHFRQLGVFQKVQGILLGTFTNLEQSGEKPGIEELILRFTDSRIPIAKTGQVGHGADSRCLLIGGEIALNGSRQSPQYPGG